MVHKLPCKCNKPQVQVPSISTNRENLTTLQWWKVTKAKEIKLKKLLSLVVMKMEFILEFLERELIQRLISMRKVIVLLWMWGLVVLLMVCNLEFLEDQWVESCHQWIRTSHTYQVAIQWISLKVCQIFLGPSTSQDTKRRCKREWVDKVKALQLPME